ncbi:MAG: hypothetical protein FJW30_25040 [Acidobacteria bacterium]|nr:hypothetical protein [Acidobacteriota bacterium]
MRVLYLDYTNAIGLGGGQRSVSLLVRHLNRERYQPLVACPPDEKMREILDPSVRVLDLNLPARFRSVSRNDASILGLPATASHLWSTVQQLKKMVASERIERRFAKCGPSVLPRSREPGSIFPSCMGSRWAGRIHLPVTASRITRQPLRAFAAASTNSATTASSSSRNDTAASRIVSAKATLVCRQKPMTW